MVVYSLLSVVAPAHRISPRNRINHAITSDHRPAVDTDLMVSFDLFNDLISKDDISLALGKLNTGKALDNGGIPMKTVFTTQW